MTSIDVESVKKALHAVQRLTDVSTVSTDLPTEKIAERLIDQLQAIDDACENMLKALEE